MILERVINGLLRVTHHTGGRRTDSTNSNCVVINTYQRRYRVAVTYALSIITGCVVSVSFAKFAGLVPEFCPYSLVIITLIILFVHISLRVFILPEWSKAKFYLRMALICACGLMVSVLGPQYSPKIYWQFDTDAHTWRPGVPFFRNAWGERKCVLAMHPTEYPDGTESPYGPWRASADLSYVFTDLPKRLIFQVTQPDVGSAGLGDGVTVLFELESAGKWQTAKNIHLDLVNHPEQRHWHTVAIETPADCGRFRIEVLPGPPGSNVFFDTVWINLERVTAVGGWHSLGPALVLADVLTLIFLTLGGVSLVARLIESLNRRNAFGGEEDWRDTIVDTHTKNRPLWFGYAVCGVAIFPSLLWIAIDRSPFGGDQSIYARVTLDLFYALIHSPNNWGGEMLKAIGFKAPGISWLGQFFVPLGYLVGSINIGLLLSIVAVKFAALALLYHSFRELSKQNLAVAILGCFVVASAPLFIRSSQEYLVESMQTLSVAWFVFIMSYAPRWGRGFILSQLVGATVFAMLGKVSSPLYCFGPGIVALAYAFASRHKREAWGWSEKRTILSMAIGVPSGLFAFLWYYRNIGLVVMHASAASSGPIAAVWGKEDTFFHSLLYWIGTTRDVFFLPVISVLSLFIFVGGVLLFFLKSESGNKYFGICSVVAILQILVVLSVFSLNANRTERYLSALVPYFALLICWSALQINKPLITGFVASAFALQFCLISAETLGIIAISPTVSRYLKVVDTNGKTARVLESIVERTCSDSDENAYLNIVAIDPSLDGDWLAPEPANYVANRDYGSNNGLPRCRYGYIGDNFFGASASFAWNSMLEKKARYFITVDLDDYPKPRRMYNQTLNEDNFPTLLQKVRTSGLFRLQAPLSEDQRILIFRRIDDSEFRR